VTQSWLETEIRDPPPRRRWIANRAACVLVDRAADTFGVAGKKDNVYMMVKGY
jgi:hypothetical protein